MTSNYSFKDKSNKKIKDLIENTIFEEDNPYPLSPVCTRENLPEFCIGRDEEIGIIKNAIEKVVTQVNNESVWIPINGSGGTGKSTIALYVYSSSKQRKPHDVNIDQLESAYLDCPNDPSLLTIKYFYEKIIMDMGKTPGNFPYEMAFNFCLKLCEFLSQNQSISSEFDRLFGSIWSEIKVLNKHVDLLMKLIKEYPNFADHLKGFIQNYDFIIRASSELRIPLSYINTLLDLLSTDSQKRLNALELIKGKNLETEDEAVEAISNLISVLDFLSKKNCLMIILDNLENIEKDKESYEEFFKLLLKFRNQIKNCVIITIGSTDFWVNYKKELNFSQQNMLEGFKFEEISLMNLSEVYASKILGRYMEEFWSKHSDFRPKGLDRIFPFSEEAFRYLYEINSRNLRKSLKELYRIVDRFKKEQSVYYIKGIREAVYYFRPEDAADYLYENEINYLTEYCEEFTDRNQLSREFEMGLVQAFKTLKEQKYHNIITKVQHEPKIKLNSGNNAVPDVYLTLYGRDSVNDIRYVEFQIKAYYSTNPVKFDEIKGSYGLLNEKKIHYLHFFTISELHDKIIEQLKPFSPHIGRTTKLNNEELCYLMLLTKEFSKLFYKKYPLTGQLYESIMKHLGLNLPDLFEKIKKLSYDSTQKVEVRVPKSTKPKQKPLPIGSPPKSSKEKIANPKRLEPILLDYIKNCGPISKKDEIIKSMLAHARSKSCINNAIDSLRQAGKIEYSRKKPAGWRIKA